MWQRRGGAQVGLNCEDHRKRGNLYSIWKRDGRDMRDMNVRLLDIKFHSMDKDCLGGGGGGGTFRLSRSEILD